MQTRRTIPLAFVGIVLTGCSDLVPTESRIESRHDSSTPLFLPGSVEAVQSTEILDVSRSLAAALADETNRRQLLVDMRDSPFPGNAIHFTAYLGGTRGERIVAAMAQWLRISTPEFKQRLNTLPDLEIVVPRSTDRVFWDGSNDIVVVAVDDVMDIGYASVQGFDVYNRPHTVEMYSGTSGQPIIMVYPVHRDFGTDPERARSMAPVKDGNTISRRDEIFDVSQFVGPVREEMTRGNIVSADCDINGIIPCDDPGAGGTIWGGYLLGAGVTWNGCIQNWYPDHDWDGFSDTCEYAIASQFAPLLVSNPSDITTKEPAWSVAPIPSLQRLVIFYAPSYHFDLGCVIQVCGPFQGATSHYGDSEWIVVQVEPVANSSRWRTVNATLSAHWQAGPGGIIDHSQTVSYNSLHWADNYRGRPRIWVSRWKHANYASPLLCFLVSNDNCDGNVNEPAPLQLSPARNLGHSWGNTPLNCVGSPVIIPSVNECYWTNSRFRGWSGLTPDANTYNAALSFFGF